MAKAVAAAVAVLLAALLVRAQTPDIEAGTWDHFYVWREAIEQHAPGEPDAAVRAMLSLTASELESVIPHMVSALRAAFAREDASPRFDALFNRYGTRGLRPDDVGSIVASGDRMVRFGLDRFLKRAAMLHADIAIRYPEAHRTRAAGAGVLVDDGRRHGDEGRPWHWQLGRAFLELVTDVARDPFVRAWYHAAGNHLQATRNFTESRPHVERGEALLPDDAEMRFLRGWMHDAFGAPSVRAARAEEAASAPLYNRTAAVGAAAKEVWTERAEAVRAYRDALDADSEHVEARLRLSRLLIEDGKPDQALPHLGRIVTGGSDIVHQYLAWLLQGRAQFELGELAAARAAYERAAALMPGAQAPGIALSQIALHAGDRERAAASLHPLEQTGRREDPWWDYFAARIPAPAVWMARLREAARAADR